jgi:ribulose-5-phosphate 4-epimerase/fuculose-1-phosphate aldolase
MEEIGAPSRVSLAASVRSNGGHVTGAPANVLNIPRPPTFATAGEERKHRKQRLAAAFRLFSRFGFDEGVAGHITARDPERQDHFWVNPFGMHFGQIRASDLILVNHQGEVVEGKYPVNVAAFAIHSRVHAARPEVVAAAHSHSMYGKAWASLGRLLDPITQDACAFYEDHGLFEDFTGVVYETSEGERIAQALGNYKAAILRNHGLLTVGQTVEEAAWWFITMDRSCQAQLLAEAAGKPVKIDHASAVATRETVGSHFAGWFQFQPMLARIIREEPGLLE